jgi:hypothetical protein
MSILCIDLHSSKSTIRLSFHFQNVTDESLDDIYCSKFSTGCNPHVLGWRPQPCISSLQLDVGCPVVMAAAIPDAMLLPTDECFDNVKDLPRSGRPRVTSDHDVRASQRLVRRMPFATSPVLKQHWLPNRRLSTRTVRNRLKSVGLKSSRVIKRWRCGI